MNDIHNHPRHRPYTYPALAGQSLGFIDIKTLTKKRFAELTGVTTRAIDGKIARGKWREGIEYILDPDGKVQIIIEGYNQWVLNSQRVSARRAVAPK